MRRSLLLWAMACIASTPSAAYAGKVKAWHHHSPAHYEKARLQGAVLNNEGTIRLARQLRPFADIDSTHVWALTEDQDGNLLVASGENGKIFKVDAGGSVTVAFKTEDSQVFCFAQANDGTIYAGTGPNGRVYRLTRDGEVHLHYQSPESYIWCLQADPENGALYAGTGPNGRMYRIAPDGSAKVHYATKQDHVLSLAMDSKGALYAGTDKNGLVYRIDGNGKGFVLFQAPQSEVRCLAVHDGALYAGTSTPRRREIGTRPVGEKTTTSGVPGVLTSNRSATQTSNGSAETNEPAGGSSSTKEEKKTGATPSAAPPSPGENSVFRIATDGIGRELFRERAMVLSLSRHNGMLFIGTGHEGQIFEVNERTKECTEIARLDNGHIHCMYRRRDGSTVIGAGDPGRLYVLDDRFVKSGSVVSAVLDAKIVSHWGSLRWQADAPEGTSVTLSVRSGNLPEPDETWSDWSTELTDPEKAISAAPPARYLQYRVNLHSKKPDLTPSVRNVTIRYRTTNQPPEIETLEVPNFDAVNSETNKKIRLKWTATDPNEDELSYRLLIRKDGWSEWVMVEENLEKREYEWDTTTAPTGMYQVKVVASDHKDNATETALTTERTSPSFPVSHIPPSVVVKAVNIEGGRATLEAKAESDSVRLTSAAYSVDGKPWINVFPTDGLFDRQTGKFHFTMGAMQPGAHVLVLKVRDAAGNTGSGDVVFTIAK